MRRRRRKEAIETRLAWIFGSPRSGSTWLVNLLAAGDDVVRIDEPSVGAHLAGMTDALLGLEPRQPPIFRLNEARAGEPDYFLSRRYESAWREPMRALLLARIGAQLGQASMAVIKEPNGSQGADVIMSLLPASRLIFLLRDGRDVLDSELDAAQPGSWAMQRLQGFELGNRKEYLRRRAHMWLWRTEIVQRAFEAHDPELRRMVRYEDLRVDAEGTVLPLADWLGVRRETVLDAARRTSFEALAAEERGPGRFARAATPGLWRKNLTADEQAEAEVIMGSKLRELDYPA